MIAYHGTNKENAISILQTGFRYDSWFALRAVDAHKFGGKYIFAVEFDGRKYKPYFWQFHFQEQIPPERIDALYIIEPNGSTSIEELNKGLRQIHI